VIVPDSITPMIGWRAWSRVSKDLLLQPLAMGQSDSWPHREPATARCHQCGSHQVPAMNNPYGLYAFKSAYLLSKEVHWNDALVFGQVWLWGAVLICGEERYCPLAREQINPKEDEADEDSVKGYRAEFAYPKALICSDEGLVPKLAAAYGVECIKGSFQYMIQKLVNKRLKTLKEVNPQHG